MKKVVYVLLFFGLASCEKKTCYTCTVTNAFSGYPGASAFNSVRTFTECDKDKIRATNNTSARIDTTVQGVRVTGIAQTKCMSN